jgi:hypothetical protein
MYLRYLLYYAMCWVFRVSKGSRVDLISRLAGTGVRKVSRARFSKHSWRKARLRMLVVRAGPRNVQYAAVYVGVEHWRHLHSWPCDRNRNGGSSQQQSATVQTVHYGCVCGGHEANDINNVIKLRAAARDGRTKYRNRVSAASDS